MLTLIDCAYKTMIGSNVFNLITIALVIITIENIEDNVQIAPGVTMLTANHDNEHTNILKTVPIHILEGAWFESRAIILPGLTIGKPGIVSAEAFAIESYTVVGGNPAKMITNQKY